MSSQQITALQQKMLARNRLVLALYNKHIAGYAPEVESDTKSLSTIMQQILPEVPNLLSLCSAEERTQLTGAMALVTEGFAHLSAGDDFNTKLDAVTAIQVRRLGRRGDNPQFDLLSEDWPQAEPDGRLPAASRASMQAALQHEANRQREAWEQNGVSGIPPVAIVLLDPNDAEAMKNAHRYALDIDTGIGTIHLPENSPRLKTPEDALFFIHQETLYHVQDHIIGTEFGSDAADAFLVNDFRPTVWGEATLPDGTPNTVRREAQKCYETAFPRRVTAGKIGAAAAGARKTDTASTKPQIDLYSEVHEADGTLIGYVELFRRMKADGATELLFENAPARQQIIDTDIAALRARLDDGSLDFDTRIAELQADYAASQQGMRHKTKREAMLLMAAHHNIAITCVDVGDRSAFVYEAVERALMTLDIRQGATNAEVSRDAIRAVDIEKVAAQNNVSVDDLALRLAIIEEELRLGTYRRNQEKALEARGDSDPEIAAYIMPRLQPGKKAYGLFGANHNDPDRPNSLLNALSDMGADVASFDIDPYQGTVISAVRRLKLPSSPPPPPSGSVPPKGDTPR